MGRINYGRVFLGALVGGIVANVCSTASSMLLAPEMERMAGFRNLDSSAMNSPAAIEAWVAINFVYAFLIVWTYAAIRPRLGPGPSTAVTAGLVLYAAISAILFGFEVMGLFTSEVYWKNAALGLVTVVVVSLAGGAVYKEAR